MFSLDGLPTHSLAPPLFMPFSRPNGRASSQTGRKVRALVHPAILQVSINQLDGNTPRLEIHNAGTGKATNIVIELNGIPWDGDETGASGPVQELEAGWTSYPKLKGSHIRMKVTFIRVTWRNEDGSWERTSTTVPPGFW